MAKEYFSIGATEGLISAIAIKFGTDVSATGIGATILNAFKTTLPMTLEMNILIFILLIIFAIGPWVALYLTAKEDPLPTIAGFLFLFLLVLLA